MLPRAVTPRGFCLAAAASSTVIDPCSASFQRAFGVAPRVVEGRSLDHADQQRDLLQLQLGDRLAEEVLTGQAEAVHRALAVLTEEHLVHVGLEYLALVVVQLQQHRHHRFGGLAHQGAFVGQVEVLHQLLGQGTAALHQAPRGGVDPHGAGDALGRDAEVIEIVAVLDRHQRIDQVGRHLVQLDQDAVFLMRRVQPADQQRLQPRHRQVAAIGLGQARHVVAGEAHAHPLRGFDALVELEAAAVQLDAVAGHRQRARAIGQALAAVAQGVELAQEVVLAQLLADEQLQRPRVDLGRHRPTLAGEFLLHHGVEVNGETGEDHQTDQTELEPPGEPGTQTGGTGFLA
jgi:hypothetical protein